MNRRLETIVEGIRHDGAPVVDALSCGEWIYVALAAGRYDLLPEACPDPVEAWYRLNTDWRRAICQWRGWPEEWAHE